MERGWQGDSVWWDTEIRPRRPERERKDSLGVVDRLICFSVKLATDESCYKGPTKWCGAAYTTRLITISLALPACFPLRKLNLLQLDAACLPLFTSCHGNTITAPECTLQISSSHAAVPSPPTTAQSMLRTSFEPIWNGGQQGWTGRLVTRNTTIKFANPSSPLWMMY